MYPTYNISIGAWVGRERACTRVADFIRGLKDLVGKDNLEVGMNNVNGRAVLEFVQTCPRACSTAAVIQDIYISAVFV